VKFPLPLPAGYQRAWLRGDLTAGLTVAAYLVRQVMACATVAGLPPVAGLWAALPALVAYPLIGSSRSRPDHRARGAVEQRDGVFQPPDRAEPAGLLGEAAGCFDLRAHRSRRERPSA